MDAMRSRKKARLRKDGEQPELPVGGLVPCHGAALVPLARVSRAKPIPLEEWKLEQQEFQNL